MDESMHKARIVRSALFVPGHRERMVEKALSSEADCIYFDLEDSVPPSEKATARQIVGEAIRETTDQYAYVRVNGLGSSLTALDLDAVAQRDLDAVILPKTESRDSIVVLEYLMNMAEVAVGLEPGLIPISASLETASGVVNCHEILAASRRLVAVSCGVAEDGDLQRELGYTRTNSRSELLYAMSQILIAARAHGLTSIMVGPYADYKDDQGLEAEAIFARDLGFTGKAAIHPRQIPVINDVFTPSQKQLEYYREIIEAMKQGRENGLAAVSIRGRMVDIAMEKRAQAALAAASRSKPGTNG